MVEIMGICRYIFRIAVGISILVLLLGNGASAATKITVPEDYAKIQWAVDNSTAGDTIEVHGGTYYENVNVTKQLTLRGIGMPLVNAAGYASAIMLSANGITLEGFKATGSDWMTSGILVTSNDNLIRNNNVSNNSNGIFLYYSSDHNLLGGNNVSNNNNGFYLSRSSNNNTLTGNNASGNKKGIILKNSKNNSIYNNYFVNMNNAYDRGKNTWNISKKHGKNIIGGPYLGGN